MNRTSHPTHSIRRTVQRRPTRVAAFLMLSGWGVILAGCASPTPIDPDAAAAEAANRAAFAAASATWQTGAGNATSWTDVVATCAAADIVLIGETHGHPVGLAITEKLMAAIAAERPNAALALEFIERDAQVFLDDWLVGITDDDALATTPAANVLTGDHAPLIAIAREAGAPVIAANSPRRFARLARTDGYETLQALSPAQRAMFVIPDPLPGGAYRETFMALFGPAGGLAHAAPESSEDVQTSPPTPAPGMAPADFFRAQALWDATMADSVAATRARGYEPVVLVAGHFHTDHDGGTLQLIRRAEPDANIVTVSLVVDDANASNGDVPRADFVVQLDAAD